MINDEISRIICYTNHSNVVSLPKIIKKSLLFIKINYFKVKLNFIKQGIKSCEGKLQNLKNFEEMER